MAEGLNVVGLMNAQFAIQETEGGDVIYVLEVNPCFAHRAFVSKATASSLPWWLRAAWPVRRWRHRALLKEVTPPYFSVKEAVFPFVKFPGVDTIPGPEMKSTGEAWAWARLSASLRQEPARRRCDCPPGQGVPDGEKRRQATRRRHCARARGCGL